MPAPERVIRCRGTPTIPTKRPILQAGLGAADYFASERK